MPRIVEISSADRDERYPLRLVFEVTEWQGPNVAPRRTVYDIVETSKITAKLAKRINDWITM